MAHVAVAALIDIDARVLVVAEPVPFGTTARVILARIRVRAGVGARVKPERAFVNDFAFDANVYILDDTLMIEF
jgi:hypothetical protein